MNIQQAIARRVDRARRRLPGEIDTERVRGAEPWTLTDQQRREPRAENAADLVLDRDPAALDDCDGADPKRWVELWESGPQQGARMRVDRRGGKPIRNHKKDVDRDCGTSRQALARLCIEA